MTDTMDLSISPELLRQINEQLADIDVQLELAGGEAPGKTKLRNEWVKSAEEFVSGVLAQISDKITDADPTFRAGVYFGITKALNASKENAWKEESEKLLEASVPEKDENAETVSLEEAQNLRVQYNNLVDQFNAVKNILVMMRPDIEAEIDAIASPEKKKGAIKGTTRGPRALSTMVFSVDGTQVAPDKNSMAGLAEIVGGFEGARPFRKALDEALKALPVEEGAKAKSAADPGDKFEVTINGHKVSGVKLASTDDDVDDEDEDETE